MVPKRDIDLKADRRGCCAMAAEPDGIASRIYADPAKALVMEFLGKLVAEGFAEWEIRETGDIELRLRSGETFLLSGTTIRRLA